MYDSYVRSVDKPEERPVQYLVIWSQTHATRTHVSELLVRSLLMSRMKTTFLGRDTVRHAARKRLQCVGADSTALKVGSAKSHSTSHQMVQRAI